MSAADDASRQAWVADCRPMVLAYALAICGDPHLAEDVCQEALLVAMRAWERFPDRPPAPWLKEVIRRKVLELRRRLAPADGLSADAVAAIDTAPWEEPVPARERAALTACLGRLRREVRAVLDARYVERTSCEDIAVRLRRPVASVYTMLKRARSALRRCIEQAIAQPDPP
jgi:RNA polymerase sigma factor (sigma-70 family)